MRSTLCALLVLAAAPALAQEPEPPEPEVPPVPVWVEPVCIKPPEVTLPYDLLDGRLKFCTAWHDEHSNALPISARCDLVVKVQGEIVQKLDGQPPGKAFDLAVDGYWPHPVTIECRNSAGSAMLSFDATFPEAVWGAPILLTPID